MEKSIYGVGNWRNFNPAEERKGPPPPEKQIISKMRPSILNESFLIKGSGRSRKAKTQNTPTREIVYLLWSMALILILHRIQRLMLTAISCVSTFSRGFRPTRESCGARQVRSNNLAPGYNSMSSTRLMASCDCTSGPARTRYLSGR